MKLLTRLAVVVGMAAAMLVTPSAANANTITFSKHFENSITGTWADVKAKDLVYVETAGNIVFDDLQLWAAGSMDNPCLTNVTVRVYDRHSPNQYDWSWGNGTGKVYYDAGGGICSRPFNFSNVNLETLCGEITFLFSVKINGGSDFNGRVIIGNFGSGC